MPLPHHAHLAQKITNSRSQIFWDLLHRALCFCVAGCSISLHTAPAQLPYLTLLVPSWRVYLVSPSFSAAGISIPLPGQADTRCTTCARLAPSPSLQPPFLEPSAGPLSPDDARRPSPHTIRANRHTLLLPAAGKMARLLLTHASSSIAGRTPRMPRAPAANSADICICAYLHCATTRLRAYNACLLRMACGTAPCLCFSSTALLCSRMPWFGRYADTVSRIAAF